MRLSTAQKKIITTLRETGKYNVFNCQNVTVRNLIELKLVDWNRTYNGLVLTYLGKTGEI